MTAEGNTPKHEPSYAGQSDAQAEFDATAISLGRLIFLAVVAVIVLLEAGGYIVQPNTNPPTATVIRWVIMAFILWRTWQGMPAAVLITRLGLALGSIVCLCVALVSPQERLTALSYAAVYAGLALVMVYSRNLRAFLGDSPAEGDQTEGAMTDHAESPTETPVVADFATVHHANLPVAEDWPHCPQCDALRMTRCPYCHTSGTNFPAADHPPTLMAACNEEPIDVFHPDQGHGCSCGPDGCGGGHVDAGAAADSEDAAAAEQESTAGMLVCPTCDEPFRPQYMRCCEWCGHEFNEGLAADAASSQYHPVNVRVVVVMIGLVIFAVVVLAYFALLLPRSR